MGVKGRRSAGRGGQGRASGGPRRSALARRPSAGGAGGGKGGVSGRALRGLEPPWLVGFPGGRIGGFTTKPREAANGLAQGTRVFLGQPPFQRAGSQFGGKGARLPQNVFGPAKVSAPKRAGWFRPFLSVQGGGGEGFGGGGGAFKGHPFWARGPQEGGLGPGGTPFRGGALRLSPEKEGFWLPPGARGFPPGPVQIRGRSSPGLW